MTLYRKGRELFEAWRAEKGGMFDCGGKRHYYRLGDWIVTPIIGEKFVATDAEFRQQFEQAQ